MNVARIVSRFDNLILIEPMKFVPHSGEIGGIGLSHRIRTPMICEIQKAVASYYGIHPSEMVSSRRGRKVAGPRQVAMYLAKTLTPKSYPMIGRCFGNRDHTTVIHAVRQVIARMAEDEAFARQVKEIREAVS